MVIGDRAFKKPESTAYVQCPEATARTQNEDQTQQQGAKQTGLIRHKALEPVSKNHFLLRNGPNFSSRAFSSSTFKGAGPQNYSFGKSLEDERKVWSRG